MATACGGGGSSGGNASQPQPSGAIVATSLDTYAATGSSTAVNLVSDGYFPMNQGDSWVYDDTADGSTTLGGLTRSVISGPNASGQVVLQELEDQNTFTERYTVSSAGIAQLDPLDAATAMPGLYQDLPSWDLYLNSAQKPGAIRAVDRSGSTQVDLDGDGKADSYRLHGEQVFKGFKTIDVLGQPTLVAHFVYSYVVEIRYTGDNSTSTFTFVESAAFARALGLVQTERIVVRDNVELSRQLLVLRAARVGGIDFGVGSGHVDKAGILQIIPSTSSGINPDADYMKASVTLALDAPGNTVTASLTNPALATVTTAMLDATHVRVNLLFSTLGTLAKGTYNDTLTITACEDRACKMPVTGSPFAVPITAVLGYTQAPESDVAPLVPLSQQTLTHDVIAAKYSRGLDRVVMVSSSPDNKLYVMNPSTGSEQSLALSRTPTALALSPDGSEAAVGHDGRVTWVKLGTLGNASPEFKLLDLQAKAYSMALDASGRVYVIPATDQWVDINVITVATNTHDTTTFIGKAYAKDTIVARWDGRALYTQFDGLSSATVHEWSLLPAMPIYVAETDSVAFGDTLCRGPLWMANDDSRLVTACGIVLNAVPGASKDLSYNTTLPLTKQGTGSSAYHLLDLSQSTASNQWAALEYAWMDCIVAGNAPDYRGCFHHLNVYDDDSYVLREQWALGPVAMAGRAYDQEGVAVFHSADGRHLYLISHLRNATTPSAAYLFQVVR